MKMKSSSERLSPFAARPDTTKATITTMKNHADLLAALLDVADATSGALTWGIAPIVSQGVVFFWDCRADSDAAIMAAIVNDCGGELLDEAIHTTEQGESILGLLVKPRGDVRDFAGELQTRYVYATGSEPGNLEPPF
jgi:hypothetical protein